MEGNKNFYIVFVFSLILIVVFYVNFTSPLKDEIESIEKSLNTDQQELERLKGKNHLRELKVKKWENTLSDLKIIKRDFMLSDRVLLRFEIEKLINSAGIIPSIEKTGFRSIKGTEFGVLNFEFNTSADLNLMKLLKKIKEKKLLMGVEYLRVNDFPSSTAVVRLRGFAYEEK